MKRIGIASVLGLALASASFAGPVEDAQGHIRTYESLLAVPNGRVVLARTMVNEYRKAVAGAVEALDQIPNRRLEELASAFEGSTVAEELTGADPERIRDVLRMAITKEEKLVSATLEAAILNGTDEQIHAALGSLRGLIETEQAQAFSAGDLVRKAIQVVAKVVGGVGFVVGIAVKQPIVFTYHFLKNMVPATRQATGAAIDRDGENFRASVFEKYLEYFRKLWKKEAQSWDDFTRRWERRREDQANEESR